MLEALAATAGELQVRFRQYESWPTRVVLMSWRFSPHGIADEARALLTAAPEALDRGYSLPLRTQAINAGGAHEALLPHMHAPAQEYIDALAVHIEGISLAVERKHRLDNMRERSTVLGWQLQVGTASPCSGARTRHWPARCRQAV